jgi:hypothetical protein
MEKIATAVPPRAPATSPTVAAGAVPRKAEATPYRQSAAISSQMFGANGTARMENPASVPPMIIAGRRPTESTKLPAGATASVWTTEAQAKATPVHDVGRCSTSTTRTGTSDMRTPNDVHPWARLAMQAA